MKKKMKNKNNNAHNWRSVSDKNHAKPMKLLALMICFYFAMVKKVRVCGCNCVCDCGTLY